MGRAMKRLIFGEGLMTPSLDGSKRFTVRKYREGGYHFDEAYFKDLATYYPDLTWDTMGAVISFEVLHVGIVPVVRLNEHAR